MLDVLDIYSIGNAIQKVLGYYHFIDTNVASTRKLKQVGISTSDFVIQNNAHVHQSPYTCGKCTVPSCITNI